MTGFTQRTRDWLRHAFSVNKDDTGEPTEAQSAVVERVCREIVRRRLTTPALAFLEMSRPLNYVGAQVFHFFDPLISTLVDAEGARQFATYLERRRSIEYLCRRIEALEAEAEQVERGA
jgi:hypothetical protein